MLFEFGFTDFVVNEYLLEKYNSVDGVADMLMNGQVSDECLKAISTKKQALAEGKWKMFEEGPEIYWRGLGVIVSIKWIRNATHDYINQ